ncbi:MAG TPA: nucleotidyltransferase family protein [Burkholderiales bacterium]
MGTIKEELSETLFSKTQRGVLGLLFGNPERSFYTNEIVRHAQAGIGAVQRELERLVAAGLLTVSRLGNQKHYQANRQSLIFDEMAAIVSKTMDSAAGAHRLSAREARAPYAPARKTSAFNVPKRRLVAICRRHRVRRLGVFGSTARGEATKASDVDLLVEFEKGAQTSLFDMVRLQEELSRLLGRKVDLATPAILENPYRRHAVLKDLREIYAA